MDRSANDSVNERDLWKGTPAQKTFAALGDWLTAPVDRSGLDRMPGATFPRFNQPNPPATSDSNLPEAPKGLSELSEVPKAEAFTPVEAPKGELRPGTWGETKNTFVGPPKSLMDPANKSGSSTGSAALFPVATTRGPIDSKFGSRTDWTQKLPALSGNLADALAATVSGSAAVTPTAPTTPGPGSGGYERLPNTDLYRKETTAPGDGPDNPNRVTTYTQPGVSGLGGGPGEAVFQGTRIPGGFLGYAGTPETKGMTQEQATASNVANLNRQTEALRDLREARNPGITTGQAGRAFGDLVSIGTPGGNFGDEAMQAEKVRGLLTDATRPGVKKEHRKALIEAAQNWTAPEQATAKRQDDLANQTAQQALARDQQAIAQQTARDTLAGQLQQHRYQADQQLEGQKYAANQSLLGQKLTAEQQAEKNRIDAENAKTQRLGLTYKPQSGADERIKAFTQATLLGEFASNPKEQEKYRAIARQLDPRSVSDALILQNQ